MVEWCARVLGRRGEQISNLRCDVRSHVRVTGHAHPCVLTTQ